MYGYFDISLRKKKTDARTFFPESIAEVYRINSDSGAITAWSGHHEINHLYKSTSVKILEAQRKIWQLVRNQAIEFQQHLRKIQRKDLSASGCLTTCRKSALNNRRRMSSLLKPVKFLYRINCCTVSQQVCVCVSQESDRTSPCHQVKTHNVNINIRSVIRHLNELN